MIVAVTGMVVAVVLVPTGIGQLSGGSLLGGGVEVLDLGLAKNTVSWSANISPKFDTIN